VESFDFAVGLWPIRAGALRGDVQFGAGVAPGVGHVGRPVVRQDSFDGDATLSEPRHRAAQDTDCGDGFLVGLNLGVGHPGMIVNDCVQECNSDPGSPIPRAFAGSMRGPLSVASAVLAA